jgi:hypothetical protein
MWNYASSLWFILFVFIYFSSYIFRFKCRKQILEKTTQLILLRCCILTVCERINISVGNYHIRIPSITQYEAQQSVNAKAMGKNSTSYLTVRDFDHSFPILDIIAKANQTPFSLHLSNTGEIRQNHNIIRPYDNWDPLDPLRAFGHQMTTTISRLNNPSIPTR